MSTARHSPLTAQEYLQIERQAAFRSEFLRGTIYAMSGAGWEHSLIKDNLARHVGNQLGGSGCRVVTSDQRVLISRTGLYTYPDVVIVCGEPRFEDELFDTLVNPSVIVEVLSASTERYDRGVKFGHYRQLPTLREYLLLAQDRPLVEVYERRPDESWTLRTFEPLSATLEFCLPRVRIPLQEIYAGVNFRSDPSNPRPGA